MIIIDDKKNCTGCTSCMNVCPKKCIDMVMDFEGFKYPIINKELCVNCRLCEKVCPILNQKQIKIKLNSYAVMNIDKNIRSESSSGGFFSNIAEFVLSNNGYVCGAIYDQDFTVKHLVSKKKDDLKLMRGAKYSQSDLRSIFSEIKQLLDSNELILFSGTPCQVGGLKSFLNRDYDNLITVDFICHGVPSPKVWKEYIDYRFKVDNKGNKAEKINLREKFFGWSYYKYNINFQYKNYVFREKNEENIYLQSFIKDIYLRPSCYDCRFKGTNRLSDFTIGDFWGVWDLYPNLDDNSGTSLVMVNTFKGEKYFELLKPSIYFEEVNRDSSLNKNPSYLYSAISTQERKKFFENLDVKPINELLEEIAFPYKQKKDTKNLIYSFIKKIIK